MYIYIHTHSKPEIDRQVGNLGIRRYIYISSIPSSIRMQPGVCFEAERNVLTGGRLVFLVETNVSRRQKRFVFQAGFVFQAETNVLVLSKLGTGSSGTRKYMFSSKKLTFPLRKRKFQGSKQTFFGNVSLKLETQNKLRRN